MTETNKTSEQYTNKNLPIEGLVVESAVVYAAGSLRRHALITFTNGWRIRFNPDTDDTSVKLAYVLSDKDWLVQEAMIGGDVVEGGKHDVRVVVPIEKGDKPNAEHE